MCMEDIRISRKTEPTLYQPSSLSIAKFASADAARIAIRVSMNTPLYTMNGVTETKDISTQWAALYARAPAGLAMIGCVTGINPCMTITGDDIGSLITEELYFACGGDSGGIPCDVITTRYIGHIGEMK